MNRFLLLFLCSLTCLAGGSNKSKTVNGWFSCDTGGNIVSGTQAEGAFVSQTISDACTAFLVTEQSQFTGNLVGKTLTATVALEWFGSPLFLDCFTDTPAKVRVYFSDLTGTYNLQKGIKYHWLDWWASPGLPLADAQLLTITATFVYGSWSDAMGYSDSNQFLAAAQNVRQIGFAFSGDTYYDTGISTDSGLLVFRILNFSIQ